MPSVVSARDSDFLDRTAEQLGSLFAGPLRRGKDFAIPVSHEMRIRLYNEADRSVAGKDLAEDAISHGHQRCSAA